MYNSFGEYLIAEQIKEVETNSFGLIMETESTPRYKVIKPPFDYSELKDKTIILPSETNAIPLTNKKHVAINYKHIIAVEE